jgi:predicted transcriptional regulator
MRAAAAALRWLMVIPMFDVSIKRSFMARLKNGKKEEVTDSIYQLVINHQQGVREQEIAALTELERRSVNNYLRELEVAGKIYKEGWEWFPY